MVGDVNVFQLAMYRLLESAEVLEQTYSDYDSRNENNGQTASSYRHIWTAGGCVRPHTLHGHGAQERPIS